MDNIKVLLKHHKVRGNYIVLRHNDEEYVADKDIEKFLFINSELYKKELMKLFHGESFNGEVYFRNDEDAMDAVEWLRDNLDRFLVMKKLVMGDI